LKKVILGKNKISYFKLGDKSKPKILFLHGFGANSNYFRPVMDYLKNDFYMIAIDFPGFGYSEKLKDRENNLDNFTDIVYELVNHIDFKKFLIIGHSLGGIISLKFVLKYPNYVKKLILQGAPCSNKYIELNYFLKSAIFMSQNNKIVKLTQKFKNKIDPKTFNYMLKFFNGHFYKLNKNDNFIYHFFKTMDLELAKELKDSLFNFDISQDIKAIKCPTLVIFGDHDEQINIKSGEIISEMVNDSKFMIISKGKNATHQLFLDFPRKMAEITRKFFAEQKIS